MNHFAMSQKELPICTACGSQYDSKPGVTPTNCKICDVRYSKTDINITSSLLKHNTNHKPPSGPPPIRPSIRTIMDNPQPTKTNPPQRLATRPTRLSHLLLLDGTKIRNRTTSFLLPNRRWEYIMGYSRPY